MMQLDPEDDEDDPNAKTPAVNANVTFNNVATSSILTDADQVVLSNYKVIKNIFTLIYLGTFI